MTESGPKRELLNEIELLRARLVEAERQQSAGPESGTRFPELYDRIPVMMHSTGADGRIVTVSDFWLETLGYAREEVIGEYPTKFLTEDSRRRAEQTCFPDFSKTGVLIDEPLQFRKKTGELVNVLLSAIAESDNEDNIVRALAVSVDVTQRTRAEETVEQYTKRLETLREIDRGVLAARSPRAIGDAAVKGIRELMPCLHALVIVFEPNRDCIIESAHTAFESKFVPGLRMSAGDFLVPTGLPQGQLERVDDALAIPETTVRRALIEERARSWISVPLQARGELIGILHVDAEQREAFSNEQFEIAREIADGVAIAIQQARLQEQVERQAAELEKRVAERTAELEMFSYSISHDLRAPLRAVSAFSQLLTDEHHDQLDDEGRRLLGIVRQNANKMRQLIEDLLAFFGLSRKEMRTSDIDMTALARETFEELSADRGQAFPKLHVQSLPRAHGDRSMLRQVFVNLLSNAIKFSEPTVFPTIEVGCRESKGEDTYFVRDNGVGFDQQYADKLFGVFQRLHTPEEFEGTGVGLAIAERIIRRHDGRIWAEGELGRGATIYFTVSSSTSGASDSSSLPE